DLWVRLSARNSELSSAIIWVIVVRGCYQPVWKKDVTDSSGALTACFCLIRQMMIIRTLSGR
ncbi:MAG: hypothetical protein MJZ16_09175, partial [Bacteroidales bacterium]|nr:hypothetical protein [Bacteroidales bacterium]